MTRKSNNGPSRRKPSGKTRKKAGGSKGAARSRKPVGPAPETVVQAPELFVPASEPEVATPEPEVAAPEPEVAAPEPVTADETDAWPAARWEPPPEPEFPVEAVPAVEPATATASVPRDDALVGRADERWLVAADLTSLGVIGGLIFLYLADTGGVVRLALALLFVTFVPGWALARAAGLAGGLTGLAIAVLASLTIGAATSTVMVWANAWHPLALFASLAAVSGVAILWTLPPAFVAARLRR